MKNEKKVLSFILFLALILSSFTMTFADATTAVVTSSTDDATVLNSFGLYSGTSTTGFEPDLGSSLTREQGVMFTLRLMGKQGDALAMTDEEVTAALSGFTDAATISDWAKKYVAYAVNNNIVKGVTDNTLGSKATLTGKQFSTLLMRAMGYDTTFDSAINDFTSLTAAGGAVAKKNPGELTRDVAVRMMYPTLTASLADSTTTVIQNLVNNGVVNETVAEDVGFTVNTTPEDTTSSTSDTGSTDSSNHHHHNSDTNDTVVAKPTPSVSGGVYTTDKAITLSCGTAGSTIYYTMDDTTPAVTSIKYVSGSTITINDNVTLKAIGVADGKTNSNIMTEKYVRKILLFTENPTTHAISSVNLLVDGEHWSLATTGEALTVSAGGVSGLTYSIASGTVDYNGNPIPAPNIDPSGGKYTFIGDMFDTILVTVTIGSWSETFTVIIS